jgi:hypothetical protein
MRNEAMRMVLKFMIESFELLGMRNAILGRRLCFSFCHIKVFQKIRCWVSSRVKVLKGAFLAFRLPRLNVIKCRVI